jgi:hypothetical protein
MTESAVLRFHVQSGKLLFEPDSKALLMELVRRLDGQDGEMVLRKPRPPQSRDQQKLIHVLFNLMALKSGHSPLYVKRLMKAHWICGSTSAMDREDSAEFIEFLFSEAAWLGCDLNVGSLLE